MTTNESAAALAEGQAQAPPLFIRVQYNVPNSADRGNSAEQMIDEVEQAATITNKQSFHASNCPTATIGLPSSVKPTKPEPGDYSYSGMHDHGPLPLPKEGGQFAQIIGFVEAAKKASDKYLTEVIEQEKTHKPPATSDSNQQHKRRRK